MKFIKVRGANQHNLKNVDVDLPRNRLNVITGVSGSGKSTLAFDTIYAEGQRRFVESLNSYARQFLERMPKPDVESIDGLPPAVAIGQTPPSRNNRSTVGTSTEIYDYFRLIYGRIGKTYDIITGNLVKKESPDSVVKKLQDWEEDTKFYILFKLQENTEDLSRELKRYIENGFFRIFLEKEKSIINLLEDDFPYELKIDEFYILVDRMVLQKDSEYTTRLTDSIETAFEHGHGRISIYNLKNDKFFKFSNIFEDSESNRVYVEPEPKLFSFNNPFGACYKCQGFGKSIGIEVDKVIPDPKLSIEKGAINPFQNGLYSVYYSDLIDFCRYKKIPTDIPYSELTPEQVDFIWNGKANYIGINGFFQELEDKSYKIQNRVILAKYRGYTTCSSCNGNRLRTSARQVFVGGKNIPDIIKMPFDKLYEWFISIKFTETEYATIKQIIDEIKYRLELILDMGLHYLNLDRLTHTLSGGEFQRLNLSTALGSTLVGTLYVLDEPSMGMHPRDTARLIKILHKLRNIGNTIIVVEHDPEIMENADHIIDMGPYAGNKGGEVIFSGTYDEILKSPKSITGQYLSGRKKITLPILRKKPGNDFVTIKHARENNLDIDAVKIPHNLITVVTGVSGSGKSTLISDILYPGMKKLLGAFSGKVGKHEKITGWEDFSDIELVDQSPIGRSSRSTPATYTKAFDIIREEFAKTQIAKQMGIKAGYFSFNVAGGRCDVCEGEGYVTIEMQFLSDIKLLCENCNGTRYRKDTQNIKLNGKTIVDVLNMTIAEAIIFFKDNKRIVNKLQILEDVGLSYLQIGQASTMLSGGEAQRIKLAMNLDISESQKKLFIFDEPTTGLHLDDISKLLKCFQKLKDNGHTVIIIEHNLYVMAYADWIIDLGPEAGEKGGQLVAVGSPEDICKVENSYTGQHLKEFMEKEGISK